MESYEDQKKFLKEQVEWCKDQGRILGSMDRELHEMRTIVVYVLEHVLTPIEVNELNSRLNNLKMKVHSLEQQLQSFVH